MHAEERARRHPAWPAIRHAEFFDCNSDGQTDVKPGKQRTTRIHLIGITRLSRRPMASASIVAFSAMLALRDMIVGPWRAVLVLGITQILAWGAIFYPRLATCTIA